MALETKTFFDIAVKNDLISKSKLEKLRSGIKKETLTDVDFEALVSKKVLTKWQAKRFLSGKGNFKIGDYRLLDFVGKDPFGEVYLVKAKSVCYLRLVSKEICNDPKKLKQYLNRVNAFQEANISRTPKITDVSEVAGRTIIVSDLINGFSIADRCKDKPQTEKLVKQLTAKLSQAIEKLQAAGIEHGSINEHSVVINDAAKVGLNLPADISYNPVKRKSLSDVVAVGRLACGMLAGNFEEPASSGSKLIEQLVKIQSDPAPTLKRLRSAIGIKTEEPIQGEDDSQLDSVPPLPNLDNVSINSEVPSVNVDGLDDMNSPNGDMFGDLSDIKVETEIQPAAVLSSRVTAAGNATDTDSITVAGTENKGRGGDSKQNKDQTESNSSKPTSKRTVIIAVVGGAVAALSIGFVIYMLTTGGNDTGQTKTANAEQTKTDKDKSEPRPTDSSKSKTKQSTKTLDTTSSGMFVNVGDINKDKELTSEEPKTNGQASPAKTEPESKQSTDSNATNDVNSSNDTGSDNVLTNGTPDPNTSSEASNTAKANEATGQDKTESNKIEPGTGEAETDVSKPDAEKTGEPETMKPDEAAKNEPEEPVLLLGNGNTDKKNDAKSAGSQPSMPNPFLASPRSVELPIAKQSTAAKKLFDIAIPASLPLSVTLHGGDKATKANAEFLMRASTSENATWSVTMKTKTEVTNPIANFRLKGQSFEFQWTEKAQTLSNSVYLTNCALKIQASAFSHVIGLRPPAISSPLDFEKNFFPTSVAKVSTPPDLEHVKIQLVNFSNGFPEFNYEKKQDFLTARSGELAMIFKKENIDTVHVRASSRLRGSKMFVNFESDYVSPDKRKIKLSTFKRFEDEANQEISKIEQLQIEYATLMNRYNQLTTPEDKAAFTKRTNRGRIENKVKADKPIKRHLERSLELLKSLNKATFGIRIYYQAGEFEVDLATPDGKPYSPPKPVEEKKK